MTIKKIIKKLTTDLVQELFKSTEISPFSFAQNIENVFNCKNMYIPDGSPTGLLRFFNHFLYRPKTVFIDFSDGKEKKTCLIGKGVLYDSGGYNIKSDASEMHSDKLGALTAITIAKKLKLPVIVFLAVNLINDDATLPGSILTSDKGKKVRIVDTDAEGRIGLAHCIEQIPNYSNLISVATLTGHSVYSIGSGHAEVFSKDKKKLTAILNTDTKFVGIGRYFKDYEKCLYNSDKVLENLNKNFREAGAAKAYAFLNEFLIKGQQLHHLDIAGIMHDLKKDYKPAIKEITKIVETLR